MKIAKTLVEHNTYEYNLLKAAEEFQELALILIQRVNKPKKVKSKMITDEIGDAKIRLAVLENLFSVKEIDKRVKQKTKNFEKYKTTFKNV